MKQLVVISVNPDCRNIFFESKEKPATGENKPCPILHPLCMELLEEKIDMPLLIYDTLDVCEESFFVLIMCLVKISTFHLRHLLKVDFDVCLLTFLFVVLLVFPFCNLPFNNLNNSLLTLLKDPATFHIFTFVFYETACFINLADL